MERKLLRQLGQIDWDFVANDEFKLQAAFIGILEPSFQAYPPRLLKRFRARAIPSSTLILVPAPRELLHWHEAAASYARTYIL